MVLQEKTSQGVVPHAKSADGTTIAYERAGYGPAVVLVLGAICDRKAAIADVAGPLGADFAVYRYDRRGRGDSGDTAAYSVEREIEDLQAVIDAAGGSARVFGHSSGGVLALRAAAAGLPISRLAVYEPPFVVDASRPRPATDLVERIRGLVGAGHRDDAMRLFITEAVGLPAEVAAESQGSPMWLNGVALAHTLPYDLEVCGRGHYLPVEEMSAVRVPTLVLDGGSSPLWMRNATRQLAKTIRGARHCTLEGQAHAVSPEALAPVLAGFFFGK